MGEKRKKKKEEEEVKSFFDLYPACKTPSVNNNNHTNIPSLLALIISPSHYCLSSLISSRNRDFNSSSSILNSSSSSSSESSFDGVGLDGGDIEEMYHGGDGDKMRFQTFLST